MTPLRQRMLEDMQVRNLSPLTQRAYTEHVARFARYFHRSPDHLGPEEIRTYLVYLTNERQLAPSSIIITVAALRFVYTVTLRKRWTVQTVIPAPKEPQRVPVVLSPAEVVQFLDNVAAPHHRTILTTCYAAGLRISEAVRLTLAAVDSQRMVLRIEQGKGQKDRYVMLSPKLLEILREWWRLRRPRQPGRSSIGWWPRRARGTCSARAVEAGAWPRAGGRADVSASEVCPNGPDRRCAYPRGGSSIRCLRPRGSPCRAINRCYPTARRRAINGVTEGRGVLILICRGGAAETDAFLAAVSAAPTGVIGWVPRGAASR